MGTDTLKTYWLEYMDKKIIIKHFKTKEEADWYCKNEGDHLWDYGPVIEKDTQ